MLLLTALLAALVVWPTAAMADPPFRDSQDRLSVLCAVDGASVFVDLTSFDGEAFLDVFVETPEGFLFGFTDATLDGTSVAGFVELRAEDGGHGDEEPEVVATASIDVTLVATGPSESFEERFSYGNVHGRFSDSFTPAAVEGTIVLDGAISTPIDPATDCTGQISSSSFFETRPATFVDRFDYRVAVCELEGPSAAGHLFAFSDDQVDEVSIELETADGFVFGYTDEAVFTEVALSATLDLHLEADDHGEGDEHDDGEEPEPPEPVGTAEVEATLTPDGSDRERSHSPRETIRIDIELLAVDGVVTVGSDVYELGNCQAGAVSGFVRFTSVDRGGRPAPNDAIEDAVPLPVPGSASVSTSSTAYDPEAPCTVVFDEEGELFEFDLPLTNTVWYSIEGTGGPVTIDTAGSDFDTIIGVYTADLQQIACVDDVDDLQARVTVETVAGEMYLVQIGGYDESVGMLEVTTAG